MPNRSRKDRNRNGIAAGNRGTLNTNGHCFPPRIATRWFPWRPRLRPYRARERAKSQTPGFCRSPSSPNFFPHDTIIYRRGRANGDHRTTERRLRRLVVRPDARAKSRLSFFLSEAGGGTGADRHGLADGGLAYGNAAEEASPSPERPPRGVQVAVKLGEAAGPHRRPMDQGTGLPRGLGQEDAGQASRQARPQAGEPQGAGAPYLAGNWGARVRKLTLAAVIRHLVGDDTTYFTANPLGDETLLMIDVDCHSRGTLEGATRFAEHLKRNFFPDLYYEVSTHGNGIQGFVVVDRRLWKDADYKAVVRDAEKWLKRVLRRTTFDVEDVELKGTPLVVSWGRRRREVAGVTFGFLAKMPRDWRRFAEWQGTTRMTAHDLRRLPELFPVPEAEPEPQQQREAPVRQAAKGSVSGKLVAPEVISKLEPLVRELLRLGTPKVTGASRAVVVAEDVQTALAVLRACTLDMNADGSMPMVGSKAIWDAAYRAGDTSRGFSFRRFAAIRDTLSDMGLLEWEDETYSFGKACKWRASGELMGMIEKALNADTTTNSSSLSILVCNSVEESRRERPDQVGLRPKGSSRRT